MAERRGRACRGKGITLADGINSNQPRRLFGTDGIRGKANSDPMTAGIALRLGQAAGLLFNRGSHRHRVVIGKDTRLSGYMIEPALTAGFIGAGMDVTLLGPLPTPAVAMLTRSLRADLGVMISASHNPYEDNGIKLFGPDGTKLSDEMELEIESVMETGVDDRLAASADLGRAARLDDAAGRYIEAAKASFPRGLRLDGLRIVVDCANGAAYKVAPTVLWELGATVIPVGVGPDGFNINRGCGSTVPEFICSQVVEHGAHLGIALDGDADRLLIADEAGELVDGDQILALIAQSWHEAGRLQGGGIVATVMSNLGLERYLAKLGLALHRTRVGDRYVAEDMRAKGINVGGEQSGHLILSDFATTGDGLLAALQVLGVLVERNLVASRACRVFERLPQRLKNVRFAGRSPLHAAGVQVAIRDAERRLGATGRLLIRESGTEPLVRVMAEGENSAAVAEVVDSLCEIIAEVARIADADAAGGSHQAIYPEAMWRPATQREVTL
jgi:phosphoglucosamine mutase